MSKKKIEIEEVDPDLERFIEMERSKSEILNPAMRSTSGIFWDEQTCNNLLAESVGNEQGKYFERRFDTGWRPARIPAAQAEVKAVEAEIADHNERRQAEGKVIGEPPAELREKHLKAQARLIVRKEEKDFIKTELVKIQVRNSKSKDRFPIFPHGEPMGIGRMELDPTGRTKMGVLVHIDGQIVKYDSENFPRITDPRSRYNGLRVSDYNEFVVKVYREQKDRLADEMRKAWAKDHPFDALPIGVQVPWPEWPDNVPKPE